MNFHLVEVEFKAEGSRTKGIETLESMETSMSMVVTLLALWVHGIFTVVELGSLLYKKTKIDVLK